MPRGKRLQRLDKLEKKVKKIARGQDEVRIYDQVKSSTSVSTISLTGTQICLPAVGTGHNNRLGDSIRIKQMHLTGNLIPGGDTSSDGNIMRLVIIQSKLADGAVPPTITDVIHAADVRSVSKINHDNRASYSIMFDKVFFVGSSAANNVPRIKNLNVRLTPPTKTYFDTGATTLQKGGVWLYVFSNAAANHCTADLQIRTEFYA